MAKYVHHGATYNGDGTTSSDAASAGAAGAWNSFTAAFAGSPGYGSLAAGDNVYVKCPTGTTTVTLGANLTGSTNGTQAAPISWIFDHGVVWSGQTGNFVVDISTSYGIGMGNYMNVYGTNQNIEFHCGWTGYVSGGWMNFQNGHFTSVKFTELNGGTSVRSIVFGDTNYGTETICTDCYFDVNSTYGGYGNIRITGAYNTGSLVEFWNCTFNNNNNAQASNWIFQGGGYGGGKLKFYGGSILNSNQYAYFWDYSQSTDLIFDGFDPGVMILAPYSYAPWLGDNYGLQMSNIPGGIQNFTKANYTGTIQWRSGQNYPTLNSIFADSGTYFSYQVYPLNTKPGYPTFFPLSQKWYNATAATHTLTVELLISQNYTAPKQNEWWIEMTYVQDSDGTVQHMTSFEVPPAAGSTTLTSSSAGWSTTAYGAISYDKYKIALTTPTDIKQYSDIKVKLYSTRPAPSATDFYFVDPEITIS